MRFKFYEVDEHYIEYLKQFDRQVPDMAYDTYDKFVCGIVLTIDEFNYFAPISSFTKQQNTNIIIKDKGRAISSIRFCFMFPAPAEVIREKDFDCVPQSYRDLLNAEIRFCNSNIEKIKKTALRVYSIGSDRSNKMAYTCCDFKLLEEKSGAYALAAREILVDEAALARNEVDIIEGKIK